MKLPCEMVQDLLPLYHDGVCSEVSKTVVQEHLKDCQHCAIVLQNISEEVEMPKLKADEAKPLKSIKRKWKRKTWLTGLLIGLAIFFLWLNLTQSCSVPIAADEYTVTNLYRFSNGMYYLEYSVPYNFEGTGTDVCRSDDGAIHLTEYRPRLTKTDSAKTYDLLIDPTNKVLHADSGKEVPLTAVYLGCPDKGDATLLWSADMDIPLANPEIEKEHLYQFVFR